MLLRTYSERIEENDRKAKDVLFGVAKSRKARLGGLAGLQDPAIMDGKQAEEKEAARGRGRRTAAQARIVATAVGPGRGGDSEGPRRDRSTLLPARSGAGFNSRPVQLSPADWSGWRRKCQAQRRAAAGIRASRAWIRSSMQLFSEAPIYDDFEIVKLADSLSWSVRAARLRRSARAKVLAGKSPRERAAELVRGTQAERRRRRGKKLSEGGARRSQASKTR